MQISYHCMIVEEQQHMNSDIFLVSDMFGVIQMFAVLMIMLQIHLSQMKIIMLSVRLQPILVTAMICMKIICTIPRMPV